MRLSAPRRLLLAALIAPLAFPVFALVSNVALSTAAAQDLLGDQRHRMEVLERKLRDTRRELAAAERRGDENAAFELRVLAEALDFALLNERRMLQRLESAPATPGPRTEGYDKPAARAKISGVLKELITLDERIREAEERGATDEGQKLRARHAELSAMAEKQFRQALDGVNDDLRGKARDALNAIREAWSNGQQRQALALATDLDAWLARELDTRATPQAAPRDGEKINLREAVRHLFKLDVARREAEASGNREGVQRAKAEFDTLGARVRAYIEANLAKLGPDRRATAAEVLDRLGNALAEGNLDRADDLATALQNAFSEKPGDTPRDPRADAERQRAEAERAEQRAMAERQVAELEARMKDLQAAVRKASDAGELERALQLLDQLAAITAKLKEARAKLDAGAKPEADRPGSGSSDKQALEEKLTLLMREIDAARNQAREAEARGQKEQATAMRMKIAELEMMIEQLKLKMRGR